MSDRQKPMGKVFSDTDDLMVFAIEGWDDRRWLVVDGDGENWALDLPDAVDLRDHINTIIEWMHESGWKHTGVVEADGG